MLFSPPTVDGRNFAKILPQFFGSRFAQIFGSRCLPGDTRTFSQASRRFLAYVFQGILTFKRKHLPEKFRKKQKNLKITYFFYFLFSFFIGKVFSFNRIFDSRLRNPALGLKFCIIFVGIIDQSKCTHAGHARK